MIKQPVDRSRGGVTIIPKYIRKQAHRYQCGICAHRYNEVFIDADSLTHEVKKIRYPKQILHHLLPRRWLDEHGYFEHHLLNLVSLCNYCHGKFKPAEDRLYQGDVIGFLTLNKQCGIDPRRIVKFAVSIGLKEFDGVKI